MYLANDDELNLSPGIVAKPQNDRGISNIRAPDQNVDCVYGATDGTHSPGAMGLVVGSAGGSGDGRRSGDVKPDDLLAPGTGMTTEDGSVSQHGGSQLEHHRLDKLGFAKPKRATTLLQPPASPCPTSATPASSASSPLTSLLPSSSHTPSSASHHSSSSSGASQAHAHATTLVRRQTFQAQAVKQDQEKFRGLTLLSTPAQQQPLDHQHQQQGQQQHGQQSQTQPPEPPPDNDVLPRSLLSASAGIAEFHLRQGFPSLGFPSFDLLPSPAAAPSPPPLARTTSAFTHTPSSPMASFVATSWQAKAEPGASFSPSASSSSAVPPPGAPSPQPPPHRRHTSWAGETPSTGPPLLHHTPLPPPAPTTAATLVSKSPFPRGPAAPPSALGPTLHIPRAGSPKATPISSSSTYATASFHPEQLATKHSFGITSGSSMSAGATAGGATRDMATTSQASCFGPSTVPSSTTTRPPPFTPSGSTGLMAHEIHFNSRVNNVGEQHRPSQHEPSSSLMHPPQHQPQSFSPAEAYISSPGQAAEANNSTASVGAAAGSPAPFHATAPENGLGIAPLPEPIEASIMGPSWLLQSATYMSIDQQHRPINQHDMSDAGASGGDSLSYPHQASHTSPSSNPSNNHPGPPSHPLPPSSIISSTHNPAPPVGHNPFQPLSTAPSADLYGGSSQDLPNSWRLAVDPTPFSSGLEGISGLPLEVYHATSAIGGAPPPPSVDMHNDPSSWGAVPDYGEEVKLLEGYTTELIHLIEPFALTPSNPFPPPPPLYLHTRFARLATLVRETLASLESRSQPSLDAAFTLRPPGDAKASEAEREMLLIRRRRQELLEKAAQGKRELAPMARRFTTGSGQPYPLDRRTMIAPRPPMRDAWHCVGCGTTHTNVLCDGPDGPKSLCEACGYHYDRLHRKREGGDGDFSSVPTPSNGGMIGLGGPS